MPRLLDLDELPVTVHFSYFKSNYEIDSSTATSWNTSQYDTSIDVSLYDLVSSYGYAMRSKELLCRNGPLALSPVRLSRGGKCSISIDASFQLFPLLAGTSLVFQHTRAPVGT